MMSLLLIMPWKFLVLASYLTLKLIIDQSSFDSHQMKFISISDFYPKCQARYPSTSASLRPSKREQSTMRTSSRIVVLAAVTALMSLILLATSIESTRSTQRTGRQRQSGDELQTCHLRELDLCLSSLTVFFQHNQHPITNSEINRQCKILMETETCLSNFTSRCMTESQSQLVDMFAEGGLDTIRELCKAQSKTRSSYLKHGDCINSQHKGQRVCMRDFQVSLEKAADINWQDRLKLGCCAFNKLHVCIRDAIEPKCGSEAYELQRQLLRATLSRVPTVACAKYEHDSKTCGSLLPPAGTQPKGAKSHSVLSKLFSAYTGS